MERKTRTRLLALAGVVVILVVGIAYWLGHREPVQAVATMDQIREVVTRLKQSDGYKDGGPYLADFERSGGAVFDPKTLEVANYRNYAVSTRLLVDWVQSLTPDQVQKMGKMGALPFESLSTSQKRQLRLLYNYTRPSEMQEMRESDFPRSAFVVIKEPGYMFMNWIVTEGGRPIKNHSYMLVDLSDRVKEWETGKHKDQR